MSSAEPIVVPQALSERPLLGDPEVGELADLFRLLSNDSRLRILHVLARGGEVGVSAISEEIGMSPQAVSNQLQRMAAQLFVASRRDGNHIYYRLVDPCVGQVMELGLCVLGHDPIT
ncbi:MAG: helix-turn-helix transcriptional regulator [Actinomycetia bacterium]|nr:helix-turn-helix transcriptional regulator [Actinomycetes bacterium]MCP4961932.1 helix-turn-helix transcriptional regulator [Actinomycetes bacterium]